jgi:hypothetical protein
MYTKEHKTWKVLRSISCTFFILGSWDPLVCWFSVERRYEVLLSRFMNPEQIRSEDAMRQRCSWGL